MYCVLECDYKFWESFVVKVFKYFGLFLYEIIVYCLKINSADNLLESHSAFSVYKKLETNELGRPIPELSIDHKHYQGSGPSRELLRESLNNILVCVALIYFGHTLFSL